MKYSVVFLLLFISQFSFSQNTFSAEITIPEQIIEGEFSEVVLTISKPKDTRNFTVFTQKIPPGFFMKMTDAQGAEYTYEKNVLKLTWVRIPDKDKIFVRYKIAPMVGISGSYTLSGKLSYMAGSEQANFSLSHKLFKIVKERTNNFDTPVNLQTDIYSGNKLKHVNCKRIVKFNKENNSYNVQILLLSNKPGSYAVTEKTPKGFVISELEYVNAGLNKKLNLYQFVYNNMPANKNVKIKYTLKPKEGIIKNPDFSGKLSFLKNGKILNKKITTEK